MNVKKDKEYLNLVFLDVEKAFDKASFSSILNTLKNRGGNGKTMKHISKLNKENEVKIVTRFGLTEPIKTDKTLKQGSVLSPIEFGVMIDEITEELHVNDNNTKIKVLTDDNDIISVSYTTCNAAQQLELIHQGAENRLMKFGINKSNVMTINDKL